MKRTIALAIAFTLSTSAASAHAHLKTAIPAAESTVAAPSQLVLYFSEDLALSFSGITVTGPGNAKVKVGAGTLSADGTTLNVPVEGALEAGGYTVVWHALSKDGHKASGSYRFTVK